MVNAQSSNVPAGWVGGFADSNPAFRYPDPDLSSLPMLDNFANVEKLQRQQKVLWPEFSWETIPGKPASRCFQMFSPDISRLGYTDEGRVYSIICPQQGACLPAFGCLNVEVSVTGQRGWVNEDPRALAADMTVEGKIWFSPSARDKSTFRLFRRIFRERGLEFPLDKAHSIRVETHRRNCPSEPIFPVRQGETTLFESPKFAKHKEAWSVANVEVEIGKIKQVGTPAVDEFNHLVMDLFNLAKGHLLTPGNLLSWNVWFEHPTLVDQAEWRAHAEQWRKSIDADHGSPGGPGTAPRYFDGRPFEVAESLIEEELDRIIAYLKKHL